MGESRRRWWATFFATLVICLCLLGLLGAFVVIDCNLRRMTTGRWEPDLAFGLEGGIPTLTDLAGQPVLQPPASLSRVGYALLSAPARGVVRLWQGEQAAVGWLVAWLWEEYG